MTEKLTSHCCWVCKSQKMPLFRRGSINHSLSAKDFAITDYGYGTTGNLYKCEDCGFIQCPDLGLVLKFYEKLEDRDYEQGREERGFQAKKIIENVLKK